MTTYRISQLAERVGLRPTTLRFYEQAGLLPAERSESGYRLYGDDSVARLDFISAGKHLGLPLDAIRELLSVWEDGRCADVRDELRPALRERLAEAERRAAELAAYRERLGRALRELDGPAPDGPCRPGCGLPHPHAGRIAPVAIGFGRPAPASDTPPVACTLTGRDQVERVRAWERLLARADDRQAVDG
ncbi:MerR family transcriptional regulator, partial [Saccharothrix hoggarensis]